MRNGTELVRWGVPVSGTVVRLVTDDDAERESLVSADAAAFGAAL